MRVLLTGDGEREKCLRRLCVNKGHCLPEHGPWDMAVLPLPKSTVSEEWADQLPRGQKVVCGLTDKDFDALATRRGWRMLRVLQDEVYTLENAALTAEGAVFTAMDGSDRSILNAECLIVGFGRIGRALTQRLRALGAKVTVAARREESRREAGEGSVNISQIPDVIGKMDFVFNTVPHPVIGREALEKVKPSALLIELASAPYGIDREEAKRLELSLRAEGGLPGRYCPISAAQALLCYMEREETQNE